MARFGIAFTLGEEIKAANGYKQWFTIRICNTMKNAREWYICDVFSQDGELLASGVAYDKEQLESYNKSYCAHFSKLQRVLA